MAFLLVILLGLRQDAGSNGVRSTSDRLERAKACESLQQAPAAMVRIHGRLYAANGGGSGYRMWLVGTHRVVWLSPKIDPAIPTEIADLFKPFEQDLYGDFSLVPLAPDQPGVMREMCLVAGERLVVRSVRQGTSWWAETRRPQ